MNFQKIIQIWQSKYRNIWNITEAHIHKSRLINGKGNKDGQREGVTETEREREWKKERKAYKYTTHIHSSKRTTRNIRSLIAHRFYERLAVDMCFWLHKHYRSRYSFLDLISLLCVCVRLFALYDVFAQRIHFLFHILICIHCQVCNDCGCCRCHHNVFIFNSLYRANNHRTMECLGKKRQQNKTT